jgi:hypothetical protein
MHYEFDLRQNEDGERFYGSFKGSMWFQQAMLSAGPEGTAVGLNTGCDEACMNAKKSARIVYGELHDKLRCNVGCMCTHTHTHCDPNRIHHLIIMRYLRFDCIF